MGFFEDLRELRDVTTRSVEVSGGVYSDPYNEIGTVVSVSDPKKLGRVKVTYQDGTSSDWIYVLNGSNKGVLSAQFIGSPCLIGKANGNSEDAFVLGFFNKSPEAGFPGAAYQVATVSEQIDAYRQASSPGDQGLLCNEGNSGRLYLFDSEKDQVLAICMRRDSRQQGEEATWSWKSITQGKFIEKGVDPGVPEGTATTAAYAGKTGIPECSKSLEGEVFDFTEDRKFRSFQIKCGRDENGDYIWTPVSAAPVFFRTTLPPCTERLHGMDAILDEGLNSQGIKCLRYQGSMKWINPGKREPIQFHRQDPPKTRDEFIDSRKPIKALAEKAAPAAGDFVGNAAAVVLDELGKSISPTGTDPALKNTLMANGILPPAFNQANFLSNIARIAVSNNSGVSIATLNSLFTNALSQGNVIDEELATILSSLTGAGDIIAQGIQNNALDGALQTVGQKSLNQTLNTISPQLRSVYLSYAAGGAMGAIDSAAMLGLPQLPPEVAKFVSPVLDIGKEFFKTQPSSINDMLNAAVGRGGGPIQDVIGGLVSAVGGQGNISGNIVGAVSSVLQGGGLGQVAGLVGNFAGLSGIPLLGGQAGLPQLATTALELVGLGQQLSGILGAGGIGLDALGALAALNPVAGILGGLGGLGGLFGGGGGDCPCSPKCRKTEHSEDSDGNTLLEECGSVIANSASSYNPDGDMTKNNENVVAEVLSLIPTAVGEDLCFPNPFDLTQLIKSVKRLNEMADRIDSAKNADWPELWTELMYTFEAVENAFKQTDNNITGVESVERKLIDAQHRLITKMMDGNSSFFSKTLISIVDTSRAIQDVYKFVLKLDAKKKGGRAGVVATEPLKIVFENIVKIATLNSTSKAEATNILSNIVVPADKEWRKLEPGGDLLSLKDVILGLIPIDVPLNFSKCLTKRNKDKALKDSLESKINSPILAQPQSLIEAKLPQSITEALKAPGAPGVPGVPSIREILDRIKYDQGRARDGQADC
jgi:hypothetical protein